VDTWQELVQDTCTGLARPFRLKEVGDPRIPKRHVKVVVLSALRTRRLSGTRFCYEAESTPES
jgi:hypothetical protein